MMFIQIILDFSITWVPEQKINFGKHFLLKQDVLRFPVIANILGILGTHVPYQLHLPATQQCKKWTAVIPQWDQPNYQELTIPLPQQTVVGVGLQF